MVYRIIFLRMLWEWHVQWVDHTLGPLWRDYALCFGQIVFLVALLPSVFSDEKPPFLTCLITALGVTGFAYVYATVNWRLTTTLTLILAFTWWVLAWQTI